MVVVFLAVGVFLPPLISLLKNVNWSTNVKTFVSMAVCSGVALLGLWASGDIGSPQEIAEKSSVVWAASQASYGLYFGNTNINNKLETRGVGDDEIEDF